MCLHLRTWVRSRLRASRRLVRSEWGAELVEAALVFPLLLAFLIGTFWMGRAYNVYQTITLAAREGARQAVAPTCGGCGDAYPSSATVTTTVKNALSPAHLDPTKATITVTLPSSPPGQVTVFVSYPFKFVVPFTKLNATTTTISTSVQMQQE